MNGISEIPAGLELDALVAKRVMGMGINPLLGYATVNGGRLASGGFQPVAFRPSSDIASAWLVWEWLQEHNPWCYPGGNPATLFLMKNEGVWSVGVMTDYWDGGIPGEGTPRDGNFAIVGPTAPLAICRAALRAVE